MDDILASIRRILNDEPEPAAKQAGGSDPDVVELSEAMLVRQENSAAAGIAPQAAEAVRPSSPAAPHSAEAAGLIGPEAATQTAASIAELTRVLSADRHAAVRRDGPALEDLVLAGLRPILQSWVDQHLPAMVERLVRAELEKLIQRNGL